MRSVLVSMVAALTMIACAPPQPTSVYESCGAQPACLGTTVCTFPDAGANGTCLPPCTRTADCPRATSGTPNAICDTAVGRCFLLCDTNINPTCPTGMQCVRERPSDSGGFCVWP
jgi:hypothetical protein